MNLNKVTLIGRLCHTPEIKSFDNGNQTAKLSVATNRSWTGKDGNKVEETEFHNVIFYGKVVEKYISQYVSKGDEVYIEGRLKTRKYEGKDGTQRQITEIIGDDIQRGQRSGKDREEGRGYDDKIESGEKPYGGVPTIQVDDEEKIDPTKLPW